MSATGLESLRVLLVEDNQHMRQIVSTILSGVGLKQVMQAADGDEALQRLTEWECDFVLLDFRMQPMDGVAFARHIRTHPDSPNPYLPIIMMTGHAERVRVMEARDAGVNEFVVKPMTARAMIDRINTVIHKPRPFVRAASYFGPDRRRRADPKFKGPFLRFDDPPAPGPA